MKRYPQICITTFNHCLADGICECVNIAFSEAVIKAGGLPSMLPQQEDVSLAKEYAHVMDGLLLTGGNENVSPFLYGEEANRYTTLLSPRRDQWELALLRAFEKANKPVLAICYGMQLLNVYRGGGLYANIRAELPEAVGHWSADTPRDCPMHNLNIIPNTMLERILGVESTVVNSYHHQCVKALGNGLRANALSSDGLIEGLEDASGAFILGVQWHPEEMIHRADTMQLIFNGFVKASHNRAERCDYDA